MNTSSSRQFPWFSGLLGRLACCSLPETSETVHNSIVSGDTFADYDDNDDMSSSSSAYQYEGNDTILDSATTQPLAHRRPTDTLRDNGTTMRSSKPCPTNPVTSVLPSPTGAPSRRELDRWDPTNCFAASSCCPSYAGSTATTASIMSEEEGYFHPDVSREEVRSNATTLVVSHRKNNTNIRRNDLLTSTLASAELRLRTQLQAEEERAKELKAQRQQQQNANY